VPAEVESTAEAAPEAAIADQQLSDSKRKRIEAKEDQEGEEQEEGASSVIVDTKRQRHDGTAVTVK